VPNSAARELAAEVADAIVAGIEADALEVIRGGEARAGMIALNREDPRAVCKRYLTNDPALEEAVRDHSSLQMLSLRTRLQESVNGQGESSAARRIHSRRKQALGLISRPS
jgi:hypothetical protein